MKMPNGVGRRTAARRLTELLVAAKMRQRVLRRALQNRRRIAQQWLLRDTNWNPPYIVQQRRPPSVQHFEREGTRPFTLRILRYQFLHHINITVQPTFQRLPTLFMPSGVRIAPHNFRFHTILLNLKKSASPCMSLSLNVSKGALPGEHLVPEGVPIYSDG